MFNVTRTDRNRIEEAVFPPRILIDCDNLRAVWIGSPIPDCCPDCHTRETGPWSMFLDWAPAGRQRKGEPEIMAHICCHVAGWLQTVPASTRAELYKHAAERKEKETTT